MIFGLCIRLAHIISQRVSEKVNQGGQVGYFKIGFPLGGFHRADARSGLGAIHPHGRQAEPLRRNNVVENALTDVQYTIARSAEAAQS